MITHHRDMELNHNMHSPRTALQAAGFHLLLRSTGRFSSPAHLHCIWNHSSNELRKEGLGASLPLQHRKKSLIRSAGEFPVQQSRVGHGWVQAQNLYGLLSLYTQMCSPGSIYLEHREAQQDGGEIQGISDGAFVSLLMKVDPGSQNHT